MAVEPETSVHGRMRQRIVAVSRRRTGRGGASRGSRNPAKDKLLGSLLQSGAITQEQLTNAVRGYDRMASELTWLSDIEEAVLGKADQVFRARVNRFPTEDSDFRINGEYHKICRSLQYNLHYYDDELERAPSEDTAPEPPQKNHVEMPQPTSVTCARETDRWAFAVVLAIGFFSAPILGTIIVKLFPSRPSPAALLIGGVWLLVLVLALLVTFPRQSK